MLNYTPPKTRKKSHDLTNPYETDAYCLTDGIINDDDKPIKHGYIYTHATPLILTCLTDIDLGGQLPTRQIKHQWIFTIPERTALPLARPH